MSDKSPTFLDWVKSLGSYWFLIVALVAGGAAWGQTINKVQTLEEAVKSNSEVVKDVRDLQIKQERIDERTQNMEKMLNIIIQNQNKSQRR